jgi:hypothetical protein
MTNFRVTISATHTSEDDWLAGFLPSPFPEKRKYMSEFPCRFISNSLPYIMID